jgi:hypothetical protein
VTYGSLATGQFPKTKAPNLEEGCPSGHLSSSQAAALRWSLEAMMRVGVGLL